ncbi:hypothetical protein [Streptomyces sp. NPDC020362]
MLLRTHQELKDTVPAPSGHALQAGPRHGTVLPVTGAGYERLLRTYG